MAILISLKKKENQVHTIFKNVDINIDEPMQYNRDHIKKMLGGKINDLALTKGVIIFSSENVDSIKIEGEENDFDYLWNQAVSLSFNQPFYGNVFIALIDDLTDSFVSELQDEFILNDHTTQHEPDFLEELKSGLSYDERTIFYEKMIDEMLQTFTDFMENIKKRAEELFSPEEIEELTNRMKDENIHDNDYVTVLYYDQNVNDTFFDEIEEINENCYYLLYKQLAEIPLSDIMNILKANSVVNLELESKKKMYHIDVKGDKKVLSEFAGILLKHFELTEDYEFCVVLKGLQTEIQKFDEKKKGN